MDYPVKFEKIFKETQIYYQIFPHGGFFVRLFAKVICFKVAYQISENDKIVFSTARIL